MSTSPAPRVLCFGEVLWDCLPTGRLPGGAPLNVAYHLSRLGAEPRMISAVGTDALGDELLAYLGSRGLSTAFIERHRRLPTGIVTVAVSAGGQPSYTIEEGVAWDDIAGTGAWRAAVPGSSAIVFGSLAARTAANRGALDELLATPGLLRVMDVNLRAPFDEPELVLSLARWADVIKLNEHELAVLTDREVGIDEWAEGLSSKLGVLEEATGCRRICVTGGEYGAALWQGGALIHAAAPKITVRDTIGAGDAFTAALVHGLLTMPGENAATLARACALGALVASLPGGQPDYDLK
ncbi:MAG: carbohydrate kinase [Chthoniobacteraceae bacterium]